MTAHPEPAKVRRGFIAAAIAALALAATACTTPEPLPGEPTVILLDISESSSADTASQLGRAFDLAYNWNTDVTLVPIGESLGSAVPVFTGRIGPRGDSDTQIVVFRSEDRTAFVQGGLAWLETVTPTGSTDIVAGLISAVDGLPEGGQLIVISDGVSTSRDLNLLTADLSTSATSQSLIDELADRALVPDFTGISVHWIGMGKSSVSAQLSTGISQTIRRFWVTYLESAGANVTVLQ